MRTGQTFLLRADQPEDLPSYELLELHWAFQRMAAIYGAAGVSDEYYEDYGCLDERGYDEEVAAKQRAVWLNMRRRYGTRMRSNS